MRQHLYRAVVFTAMAGALAAFAVVACGADAASPEGGLVAAWGAMCRAEADSPEFSRAGELLKDIVRKLPASRRFNAAAAIMTRGAPDNVNAAAMRLFGDDPFPEKDVRRALFDARRSYAQRLALRTHFALQFAEAGAGGRKTHLRLIVLVTERVESLAGKRASYGEQRFLTHLCQSVLLRYADKADELPQVKWLIEILDTYALAAGNDDVLAASIRGWVELLKAPSEGITTTESALTWLGHWDPLARWQASEYLAQRAAGDPNVVKAAWGAMSDPRDEARAAAVMVFAAPTLAEPKQVVRRLVEILTRDRGVTVQAAASVALAAQAEHAGEAITPLLNAFKPFMGRLPGRKRAGNILSALSRLVGQADQAQRDRMLRLAVEKLSFAPQGALELLKELGPLAKSAMPAVKAYRRNAVRPQRLFIDRHVLPAIAYGIVQPEQD